MALNLLNEVEVRLLIGLVYMSLYKSKEFKAYDLATTYSEELLKNGLANYLEVLTARQNALNSQIDIINAQLTRLNATVEIYRALGGGWQ